MKKFLLPLQNMVRADLFPGSLAVWNARGFKILIGGGGEIRTREALRPGGFQDRWNKPLSDSSNTSLSFRTPTS